MYDRGRFALIMGGIVLVAAIILRVRWQYVPPQTEKNIYWIEVMQQAFSESLQPTDNTPININSIIATTTAVEPLVVTPDVKTSTNYQALTTIAAVTGVQPILVPSAEGFDLGFLFGERFVVKHYEADWQPVDGEYTLVDSLQLINGQLPYIYFSRSGDEYILLYTGLTAAGTVELREKRFTDLTTSTADITLLTDLPSTARIEANFTNQGGAVLITQPDTAPQLISFSPAGQRLAEVSLDQFTTAETLIGDNDNWLVFGQTNDGIQINKLTNLGELLQTVTVALPSEISGMQSKLNSVVRSGDNVVILFADRGLVLSDNFTQQYGEFMITTDQLYPSVALRENKLYFTYDTPITLTEYQIHSAVFELAPIN